MQKLNQRRARTRSTILAMAGLLFVQMALVPAQSRASGAADSTSCLWRVGVLQIGCLVDASKASPRAAARIAAARLCQQTLQGRLQVCHARAAAPLTHVPPTSGALSGPPDSTSPAVTTDKFEYRSGDSVTMTGSGWQTNERVTLLLHVDPAVQPDVQFFAVADEDGNFSSRAYTVQANDAGVTFSVTATGRAGETAQTAAFVDPPAASQGAKGTP